ncbi:JAB domain-containing protein [Sphingomonas bacterium]|uniref:JAB domain-containing protein n=1 Tax=Sphingomonas bacterium TaxID=1895847 RepID=UPI0015759F63|nr:JAB domain-containing protein [Sphingomonas bacterium]
MSPDADPFARARAALLVGIVDPHREIAGIGYFDPEWRLLGRRHVVGGAAHIALPIRTIIVDALAFGARDVVIAHGHPSGDPAPSIADIAYTRLLARTLAAIDMRLADHLIVTPDGTTALRALGLL